MIFTSIAFLVGVLLLCSGRQLPNHLYLWFAIPAATAFLLSHHYWLRVLSAGLLGFLWCLLIAHQVMDTSLPEKLEGRDVILEGVIDDFPVQKGRVTRFVLKVQQMAHGGEAYSPPGRVRLNWYHATALPKIGERWRITARLKQPHGFFNPGGFDYEGWLFQQRIRATGYVRRQAAPLYLGDAGGVYTWHRLRYRLMQNITRQLPDSPLSGLITALAVGERQDILPQQWEVLRRTGTAHLMAISGLHIGLIAGLGFWLGHRVWRFRDRWLLRLPAQKFAAIVAMLFALIYAALAGFSIPTQRALIMVCVAMLALYRQGFIQTSQVLAISMLLVLLLDPLSVMSAGFWLSFMAVAIILYGLGNRRDSAGKIVTMIKMQWVVVVGLIPFTIGLFQQASVISPLTNLIAIPLVGLIIVPLILLACLLLWPYEALAGKLLFVVSMLLEKLWWLLEAMAQLPYSQLQMAASPLVLGIAAFGVLLMISPRGLPMRWFGMVLCLPLFFPVLQRPAVGEVWLSLLDVGQGLATVVETHRHTLVYDTGPRFSDSFDTGEAVVAPYLRHRGVRKIDMLMVSHSDNDHIGGAVSLQRLFPIERMLSSVPDKLSPEAAFCHDGLTWQWDNVRFSVIHPGSDFQPTRRRRNNLSCVLHIASERGSLLLTGDIEKEAESAMLSRAIRLDANVLVAPHHGSGTSSSTEFIKAVSPQLALYAAGYRNRYRFPSNKVVERYTALGISGLTSANSGRILVTFPEPGRPHISRYRKQAGRFWNHQLP